MKTRIKTLLVVGSLTCLGSIAFAGETVEIWNKNCASCHAKDGSGNTTMGKKAGAEDYRDAKVQAKFTDEEAAKIIKEGKKKMKPFKEKLADDEIKALVAYVRAFKK